MALGLAELRELVKNETGVKVFLNNGEFCAYYGQYTLDCTSMEKFKESLTLSKVEFDLDRDLKSSNMFNHDRLEQFLVNLSEEEICYLAGCYLMSLKEHEEDSDSLWETSGYIERLDKDQLKVIYELEYLDDLREQLRGYLPYLSIPDDLKVKVYEETDWGNQYLDVQCLDLFNWESFLNLITDANHAYGVELRNSLPSTLARFELLLKERYPDAPIFRHLDMVMLKTYLRRNRK